MAQYPIDIKIDTGNADRNLNSLNNQLDQTANSAKSAAQAANTLSKSEQQAAKSAQVMASNTGNATSSLKTMASGVNLATNAVRGFMAIGAVSSAIELGKAFIVAGDAANQLEARIARLTGSTSSAKQTFQTLADIASKTGGGLADTERLWETLSSSLKDSGATNDQILRLTETLQKIGRVGGSSAEEMSNALRQFGQSISSGVVRAEEFNSIVEQMPELARQMAAGLGISMGELRQQMLNGELTAEQALNAIIRQTQNVDEEFSKLPRSLDQATNSLSVSLATFVASMNDVTGASNLAVDAIDTLTGFINKLGDDSTTTADKLWSIAGVISKLQPGAIGASLADLVWSNDDVNNAKAYNDQVDRFVKASAAGYEQAKKNRDATKPISIKGTNASDAEAQKQIKNLKEQITYTQALADGNYELAASQKLGNKATKEQIADYAALLKQQAEYKENQKNQKKSASAEASAAKRAQKELERNQAANQKYLKTLQDKINAGNYDVQLAREQVQIALTQGSSVEQLTATYQKEYQVRQQLTLASQQAEAQSRLNKDATDAERAAVDAHVAALQRQQQIAQLSADVKQVDIDVKAQLNPYQSQIDQVNQQEATRLSITQAAREQDLINEQQYQDMKTQIQQAGEQARTNLANANYSLLLQSSADFLGQMAAGLAQSKGEQSNAYKAMFALSKAFSIAQASINLWTAVSQAMALPFPANIPFIAQALAYGTSVLGNIQSVAATGFATGGYVKGPGTGQSDSINARLSNGEFVSTKQATSRYRSTLEAMNRGTYTPGSEGGSSPNIQVHNYGGERVQVKQGLTRDDVVLIIGEEFPRQSAAQWNDPYSQTNKAFRSNYDANRKI
ncbi:tail length tape measure protein [Escherichia phage vB_EcoS_PJ16]|nr:tail length tape measure protein [Escherichia phage vB_EcoS_PJ16]